MTDFSEMARDLLITEEAKDGLFIVENGVEGTDAWLDTRDGVDYYVYGQDGVISNPDTPLEIEKLLVMKRAERESNLNVFTEKEEGDEP